VGDNKLLVPLAGVLTIVFLPGIIVVALILGSMAGLAEAEECSPAEQAKSTFGYPTAPDKRTVAAPYVGDNPESALHGGIDYAVPVGTDVMAAADGEVLSTDDDMIRIKHPDDFETRYKYLDEISVRTGEKVTRGQKIGKSGQGDEGYPGAGGAHLHFEIRIDAGNGDRGALNPADLLSDAPTSSSGGGCGCGGSGELVGTDNVQKAFNYFVSKGYSPEQSAGIVGNMIAESGVEPMRLQNTASGVETSADVAKGSDLGWGIVQWTPPSKMINPSIDDQVEKAEIESLAYQLDFLAKQLNGEGPIPEAAAGRAIKGAETVADAAYQFGHTYERFAGHENPNASTYGERKRLAQEVFDTNGGAGGCGAGNGDIVQTALLLAWGDDGHNSTAKSAAKPEYQEAMPKYNGATDVDPYTDCGVFVATVMVMSGVDPDYQERGTGEQLRYVQNSSKYDVMRLTDLGQLKPGDILITNGNSNTTGHTYIYTGNYEGTDGETYNAASASLHGHPPEAERAYLDNNYWIARIKKSNPS